jgi:hypothetical protein
LCYGPDGAYSAYGGIPGTDVERYGVTCHREFGDPADVEVFFNTWTEVPSVIDETVVTGDDPPDIFLDIDVQGFGGPWLDTTGPGLIKARLSGWVVNSINHGPYIDEDVPLFQAAFAASWRQDKDVQELRIRGTLKGFLD